MEELNRVSQLSEPELRLIFELMPNGFALFEMIYDADNQPAHPRSGGVDAHPLRSPFYRNCLI